MALRVAASILMLLAGWAIASSGPAHGEDTADLPASIKLLDEPVELRFQPMKHFIFAWSTVWEIGAAKRLIEAFAMEGKSEIEGDGIVWTYTVYNIGHDQKAREMGSVRAVTGIWGDVIDVSILSNKMPAAEKSGMFDLLDENKEHFLFPLCCLPHHALRANDPYRIAQNAYGTMQSVVAGLLEQGGSTYLVIKHSGAATEEGTNVKGAIEGYSLIDLDTGLTVKGITRNEMTLDGGKSIVSVHRTNAQY